VKFRTLVRGEEEEVERKRNGNGNGKWGVGRVE